MNEETDAALMRAGHQIAQLQAQLAEAQRDNAKLRESHKTLHRRCQEAEAALPSYRKLTALPPNGDGVLFARGNMGRALLASLASKQADEIDTLREFVAAADAFHAHSEWEMLADAGNDIYALHRAMLEKRAALGE